MLPRSESVWCCHHWSDSCPSMTTNSDNKVDILTILIFIIIFQTWWILICSAFKILICLCADDSPLSIGYCQYLLSLSFITAAWLHVTGALLHIAPIPLPWPWLLYRIVIVLLQYNKWLSTVGACYCVSMMTQYCIGCNSCKCHVNKVPDSMVHGTNMGPTWGRQDPGGPHVGPMNLAILGA